MTGFTKDVATDEKVLECFGGGFQKKRGRERLQPDEDSLVMVQMAILAGGTEKARERDRHKCRQRMGRKSLKPSLFVCRLPLRKTSPQPPAASQGPYCILSLWRPTDTHKCACTHSLKPPLITTGTHVYRELSSCVHQTHARSMKSLFAHLIPVPSGYQKRDTIGEGRTKKRRRGQVKEKTGTDVYSWPAVSLRSP